ncbi:MAG: methyltransferase domain-containing protein [Halothiobacillaceae bacterium]
MSDHYDYAIDPAGDSTANKVLRMVGQGKHVLELGTASGVMTQALVEQGCRVVGVEYCPEFAECAAAYCEKMIVGDVERIDWRAELGDRRFDVIVAADVLEHLREPAQVLERLSSWLSPDGSLVISVPNVAHAGLVAGLMRGRFQYRPKGLLDQTHLRFFTRENLDWMLLESGWRPLQWAANRVPVLDSEFASDWLALTEDQRTRLSKAPDADVYQFIVRAEPAGHLLSRERALLRQVQDLRATLQEQERAAQERARRHEADLASLKEHQKAFAEARELIDQLQVQLRTCQSYTQMSQAQKDSLERQLDEHRVALEQSQSLLRRLSTPAGIRGALVQLWRAVVGKFRVALSLVRARSGSK